MKGRTGFGNGGRLWAGWTLDIEMRSDVQVVTSRITTQGPLQVSQADNTARSLSEV
jgi:hypothetical protein